MFCDNCGTQLPDDTAFCNNCGKNFSNKEFVSNAANVPVENNIPATNISAPVYAAAPAPKKKTNMAFILIPIIAIIMIGICAGGYYIKKSQEKEALEHKITTLRNIFSEKGHTYEQDGVYLEDSDELYFEPDYNTPSGKYFVYAGNRDVYDYEVVTEENKVTLWLKIDTDNGTYWYPAENESVN